jgi:hypothetical protein
MMRLHNSARTSYVFLYQRPFSEGARFKIEREIENKTHFKNFLLLFLYLHVPWLYPFQI